MRKRKETGGIMIQGPKAAGAKPGGLFSVFLCFFIGAAAGVGSFGCVAEGFSLTVSLSYVAVAVICAAAVFSELFCAGRLRPVFFSVSALLLALTAFGLRDTFLEGFRAMGLNMAAVYGERFGFRVVWESGSQAPPERVQVWVNMTAAFVMVVQQLFLTAALSSQRRRVISAAALTLPFFAAPLAAGIVPAPRFLIPLVLSWGLMVCGGRRLKALPALFWTGAMALAALLITTLVPAGSYRHPQVLEDLRNGIIRGGDLTAMLRTEGIGGQLGSVDLKSSGDMEFTENVMLKVRSAKGSADYLKGFVGAVYEDQAWMELSDSAYEDLPDAPEAVHVQNYPYQFLQKLSVSRDFDQYYYDLSVSNVGTWPGIVYIPYGLIDSGEELGEILLDRDLGAVSENSLFGTQNYRLHGLALSEECLTLYERALYRYGAEAGPDTSDDFFTMERWRPSQEFLRGLPDGERELLEQAVRYRDFAYGAYTQVPGELAPFLEDYLKERGISIGNYPTVRDFAVSVARTVQDENVYTLTPGLTPEGEDFVEYFLTESHRGYCRHFASAVCLLLRASGVPARYVEGYVASPWGETDEEGWMVLRDSDAHAWVEIYVSGVGWIPVEATGASAGGLALTDPAGPEESSGPVVESTEAEETESETEESTAPSTESAAPRPQDEEETETAEIPAGPLAAALAGVLAASILLNRLLRVLIRRMRLRGKDRNRAALFAYRYIRELYGVMGGGPPWKERFLRAGELAEKARFSRHGITEAEREELIRTEKAFRDEAKRRLPFFKRLKLRWIGSKV